MINVTNLTDTSKTIFNVKSSKFSTKFLFFVLLAAFLTLILSAAAFSILWRCKKLTFQIRFLSMNLMLINMVFGLTVMCVVAVMLFIGEFCAFLQRILPFIFITYQLIVSVIGVDRMMSLKFSIRYTFWHRKRNAYILTVFLYSVPVVIFLISNISENAWSCGDEEILNFVGLVVFAVNMMVIYVVNIVMYIYIGVVALKKKTLSIGALDMNHSDFRQYWRTTVKAFHLSIITFLMLGPFAIRRIAVLPYFDQDNEGNSGPPFDLVLAYLHQIISPIFTLVTYKECRYKVQHMFLICCERKKEEIEKAYKQYYASFDITIASRR